MTSYAFEVKRCPKCGSIFTTTSLHSCNTIGAKHYTDGFIWGPMYGEQSALLRCPSCEEYLWRDELPTIESTTDYDYYRTFLCKSLPDALDMGLLIYESAVRMKAWHTGEQEKHIRIRSWWLYNSAYRKLPHRPWRLSDRGSAEQQKEQFVLSCEQEDNLRALLKLLDLSDLEMLIMRAEIFRELGEFEECLELLSKVTDGRLQRAVDVIRRLAMSGKRRVEIIDTGQ